MSTSRKPSGHPAKNDLEAVRLLKNIRATMVHVKNLEGRISEENHVRLRAAVLGLMWAYSDLTGLPAPDEIVKKGM